jgi:hypothetical protein
MLTDYTTYNDLRAAIGVSSTDLPDEVLSLNLYELILKQEFEAIDLTLESTYIMTEALTTPHCSGDAFSGGNRPVRYLRCGKASHSFFAHVLV